MAKKKPTEVKKTKTVAVKKSASKPSRPAGESRTTASRSTSGSKRQPRPAARVVEKPQSKAAQSKRVAPSRTHRGNGDSSLHEPKVVKTTLRKEELEEFRQLLLDKRRELIGDMNNLQNEAMRQGSSGESSGTSSMPIHMADIGTDTWEQELTLGLIENERGLLREIEEALHRIDDRTYGICLATSKPITKARLRAKPWAKYCIEYARKRELGLA